MASREIHDIIKAGSKIFPQTSTDAVLKEDSSQNLQEYIEQLETRLSNLESKTQKLNISGDFDQDISAPGFFQSDSGSGE